MVSSGTRDIVGLGLVRWLSAAVILIILLSAAEIDGGGLSYVWSRSKAAGQVLW